MNVLLVKITVMRMLSALILWGAVIVSNVSVPLDTQEMESSAQVRKEIVVIS